MYLVIDQGNTLTKIACFKGNDIVKLTTVEDFNVNNLMKILDNFRKYEQLEKISHGIISSVVEHNSEILDYLKSRMEMIVLSGQTPLPISSNYKTPETLGNDRIAASVGALGFASESNILVIDAGTCITYDLILSTKEYMGGGISPGIEMRFKALNTFTGKLPLISRTKNAGLVGDTTESSIRSGVQNGVLAELEGIISKYESEFSKLKIFFTGGDAKYFVKKLKSNIFALPNLVLLGLKDILKYNVEN